MTRKSFKMSKQSDTPLPRARLWIGVCAVAALVAAPSAVADASYRQVISHDPAACSGKSAPAALVTITGIKSSSGKIRVQSYRAIKSDWLKKGKWLSRIELPARAGTMQVCMPLPGPGIYGIAVRHDVNGNGKTDLSQDGGGMSNNPSINIFNLGKPSYKKTGFSVESGVRKLTIEMKYM